MSVISYPKNPDLLGMRELPHNLEAEQDLLGMILINNDYFEDVSEILKPHFFYAKVNQDIFEATSALISQGLVADPITLKGYLQEHVSSKSVGDSYLVQLVNNATLFAGITDYANIIKDLYLRRKLISIAGEITKDAHNIEINIPAELNIEKAEAELYDLSTLNERRDLVAFSEILTKSVDEITAIASKGGHHLRGVTTGLIDLDNYIGGLNRSDLIILAGRPSMGKTALATNMAFNAAQAFINKKDGGGKVAFFSLEMSAEQIGARILAQHCHIASERIRRGEIRKDELANFVKAKELLNDLPLFIDDSPALTPASIRTRARKLKRTKGLDLIVIDYLQLLASSHGFKVDNRVQEIAEITRNLKCLAKELDVPVIALSQLSRAVELRDDKRPQLADLRESGSIEQDADIVMFVYREEYYLSRKEPTQTDSDKHRDWEREIAKVYNTAEIILAKQRHGPVGTVRVFFDGKYIQFSNLSGDRKKVYEQFSNQPGNNNPNNKYPSQYKK